MKIFLVGYFGFGNVGDELLATAAMSAIRRRFTDVRFTLLSGQLSGVSGSLGEPTVALRDPLGVFNAIRNSDRVVFGGGGIFQDVTSTRSLAYYLLVIAGAILLRKPVSLCNVGVDPIKSRVLSRLMGFLFNRALLSGSLRDDASAANLRATGARRVFPVTADGVFSLAAEAFNHRTDLLLVVRAPSVDSVLPGAIFKGLAGRAPRVSVAAFQPGDDVGLSARLCGEFSAEDLGYVSATAAPSVVAGAGRVVSARFHALVLAAMAGRPFLGIGDPGKIRSLCRALGMPYLPWSAGEAEVHRALSALFVASPPDPVEVAAYRDRAERGFNAALGRSLKEEYAL